MASFRSQAIPAAPFLSTTEALHESTQRADCTRRLLRDALLHRQAPGKIEGLLSPNSWRESDHAGKSVLHQTWLIPESFSIPAVARLPTSQRSSSKHRRISTE